MSAHVLVWDLETVPDLHGFAAANGHDGKSDDEIRVALGDKFPKHIYHSIICIGALIVHQENEHWVVDALGVSACRGPMRSVTCGGEMRLVQGSAAVWLSESQSSATASSGVSPS